MPFTDEEKRDLHAKTLHYHYGVPFPPPGRVAPPEFMKTAKVVRITGLSRTTLWRMRSRGDFPEPKRLSAGCVRYWSPDVYEWMAAR